MSIDVKRFSDMTESERRLAVVGLQRIEFSTVAQTWRISSADELFVAVINGSVRAAATLRGQKEESLEKIRAKVASDLAEYKIGDEYRIPMPVVVASGARP